MRKVLLGIIGALVVSAPALAVDNNRVLADAQNPMLIVVSDENDDSFLDLSPVTIYKMLTEEKKKVHSLAQAVMMMRERLGRERAASDARIDELERKMELHAKAIGNLSVKAAGKTKVQKKSAKPQAIPIVTGDGENVGTRSFVLYEAAEAKPWVPYCDGKGGTAYTQIQPWGDR